LFKNEEFDNYFKESEIKINILSEELKTIKNLEYINQENLKSVQEKLNESELCKLNLSEQLLKNQQESA